MQQPKKQADIHHKDITLPFMKRLISIISIFASLIPAAMAAGKDVRWHNEASDTTEITRLLISATEIQAVSPEDVVESIGREFIGKPYRGGTLEETPEMLTVNLDEMDCMTFVETVAALVLTVRDGQNSWQSFADMLARLRYRQDEADGYASRLHYFSDWVVTNTHKGLIQEVSGSIPQSDYQVKTLDYMSRHRDEYPALTDQNEYERIKAVETGYRSHRFPYVKSGKITSKPTAAALKSGDIIALTTKTEGLDVSHLGLIVIEKDGPHLLHASQKEGCVTLDKLPLSDYLRKARHLNGFRIIRLK